MTQALVVRKDVSFDDAQIELVKRTIMPAMKKKENGEWIEKPASDDELQLFIYVCKEKNLNPLTREIYAMRNKEGKLTFMTSIDGLRIQAERGGHYAGQRGPFWCGEDGLWKDVWLSDDYPVAAKVGVLRHGFQEPVWGIAKFKSYAQWKEAWTKDKKNRDGSVTKGTPILNADGTRKKELVGFWAKGDEHMLAKCAEAIALRKAFPTQLGESGAAALYIAEEAHAIAGEERGSKEKADAVAAEKIAVLKGPESPQEAPTGEIKPPRAMIPDFQPPAYKGSLTLSWDEDGMIAYLSGDKSLLDLIGADLRQVLATYSEAKKRWIVPRDGAQQIRDACQRENIELVNEVPVLPSPSGAEDGAVATSPSQSCGPIIQSVKPNPKKPQAQVFVKWGDKEYGCFAVKLFGILRDGIGKPANLLMHTQGDYTNIVGIVQIGEHTFTEIDGEWKKDVRR